MRINDDCENAMAISVPPIRLARNPVTAAAPVKAIPVRYSGANSRAACATASGLGRMNLGT